MPSQYRAANSSLLRRCKYLLALPLCITLILVTACGGSGDDTATASEQKAQSYIDRANSYAKQGQFKAAIIEARNALQMNPENIDASLSMALVFNRLGYSTETIKLLEPLAQKPGFNNAAKLALLEAYIDHRKPSSAKELLAQIEPNTEQSIEFILLKARLASLEKQHSKALQILTAELEKTPKNLQLLTAKAQAYGYAGQLADATKAAKQVLEIEPNHVPALTLLALISYQTGQLEAAEDYLSNALVSLPNTDIITPEKTNILKRLTHVLSSLGRSNEALIYAQLLSEAAPEQQMLEAQFNEAMQAYNAGELEKAKHLLEELHKKVANKSTTGTLLASINYQQGNIQSAESYLQQYADPEVAGDDAIYLMALTHLRRGNPDKATLLVKKKIQNGGENATLLNLLAAAQLHQGQYQQAQATLDKALRLDKKQAMNYALQAQLAEYQGNKQLIPSIIQKGIAATNYHPSLVRLQLQRYEEQGSYDKAFALTQKLIQAKPDQADSFLMHAIAANGLNKITTAEKSLKKALEIDPKSGTAQLTLGKLALNKKAYNEARQWFKQAIENSPELLAAYDGLLSAYTAQQQTKKGLSELNTLLDKDPKYIWAAITLATYHAENKQYKQAESYIEQALTLTPNDERVKNFAGNYYATRAKQLQATNSYSEIRKLLITGLSQSPNNLNMLTHLAINEAQAGERSEALKILQRIEEQANNPTLTSAISGDVYSALKDHKTALGHYQATWQTSKNDVTALKLFNSLQANQKSTSAHLEQWLKAVPRSINAHFNKAIALQSLEHKKLAQQWYEKTLALAPEHIIALNNLAWLYYEDGDKRALSLAKKAFHLSQQDPLIADTYGWILVNSGQKERGISILRQAAKQLPENQEIQLHLKKAEKM